MNAKVITQLLSIASKNAPTTETPPGDNQNTSEAPADNPNYKPSADDTEYVVDRIVQQFSKGTEVKYIVRWYKYKPADDTVG